MFFGSKYVYVPKKHAEDSASDDEFSEEELDAGMDAAWSRSTAAAAPAGGKERRAAAPAPTPSKPVGVFTFSSDVTVLGDGTGTPTTIAGDKLQSYEQLVETGRALPVPAPIKESRDRLSKSVFALQEGGQTALGPALLVAVQLAATRRGSRVVLCTDGLATVGVGSLDGFRSEVQRLEAEKFYENVGLLAKVSGVTVSVVTIKTSDEVRLEALGRLADVTSGAVDIVDPLNIRTQFANFLNNPLIATNAVLSLHLPRGLCVRENGVQQDDVHYCQRELGNVTGESEASFEYGINNKFQQPAAGGKAGGLPFQLQVRYQKLDGTKIMRVITQVMQTTSDRTQAEAEADIRVISAHVVKQAATQAQDGDYSQARMPMWSNMKLLQRAAQTPEKMQQASAYVAIGTRLESDLRTQQVTERAANGGRNYSDEEADATDEFDRAAKKEQKKVMRKAKRADVSSNAMYASKAVNSHHFG